MGKLQIVHAVGTKVELEFVESIYCRQDTCYFKSEDEKFTISQSEEKLVEKIKDLEEQLSLSNQKYNNVMDILLPGWDDYPE